MTERITDFSNAGQFCALANLRWALRQLREARADRDELLLYWSAVCYRAMCDEVGRYSARVEAAIAVLDVALKGDQA